MTYQVYPGYLRNTDAERMNLINEHSKYTLIRTSHDSFTTTPIIEHSITFLNMSANEIPQGDAVDNDYQSRSGQQQYGIPVQKDEAPIEDTEYDNGGDSDEQLARDEKDAIDETNILNERTRGATKEKGTYTEPGDEEGLGGNDGTSSGRQ